MPDILDETMIKEPSSEIYKAIIERERNPRLVGARVIMWSHPHSNRGDSPVMLMKIGELVIKKARRDPIYLTFQNARRVR